MSEHPKCPSCGQPLKAVRQSSRSVLNREQWESQRAGDWYCDRHPAIAGHDRGKARFSYFWDREVVSPPAAGNERSGRDGWHEPWLVYGERPVGETPGALAPPELARRVAAQRRRWIMQALVRYAGGHMTLGETIDEVCELAGLPARRGKPQEPRAEK